MFRPGAFGSLRKDGWSWCTAAFQSLVRLFSPSPQWGAGRTKSEQRRSVLPAPLAGLLSWPFSAKEGRGELGQS